MQIFPLTQTQLGIYIAETAAEGKGEYNIDLVYYLDKEVDLNRLQKALKATVNKHPYIKSILTENDKGEIVLEDHSNDEAQITLKTAPNREMVLAEIGLPFNMLHNTLYRLTIYTLDDGNRILYMDFHHILCDGMSCTTFHREISETYDKLGKGDETECIPERYGFEIAEKETALRQTEAFEEAKQWYANEFGAASEIDSMPLSQQDLERQDDKDEWLTEFIDLDVKEDEVKACCANNGVGISIPFTTAFGFTLSNYTASEQVLFSTIWHGREKDDFGNLAMMVKTLPVFIDFSKLEEVGALMQGTKHQLSGARQRTVYSFAELTNDLDLHPQVCFAYHDNIRKYQLVLDGRKQKDEYVRRHSPGMEMIVNLIKVGNGYQCLIEYNSKSYSSTFIHQMCDTYGNILRGMLTHTNINEIDIVNDVQTATLDGFNAGKGIAQTNENETIVSLFRKTAAAYPDNIAVVYQDTKLTYRQLDEMSDRLAAEIIRRGEWNGVTNPVTSIMIGRSEQMAVCALAAQKAGSAYQPLDPSYPQERLNFMVKDSDAQVLICDKQLWPLLTDYDRAVIFTDEIIEENGHTELPTVTPDSTFILLYTSGSTGTPKGVVLQHRNLVAFCDWYRHFYQLTPESRVLAYASFGFDADMMDLYPALTTGAAVVIAPEAMRLDLETLNHYMADNKVTHSFMTTQVGYQFATAYPTHPTLQHLSVGGEKLASLEPPTGYKFYNGYGPTECTIFSTVHQVTHNETNIPIGQPLDALQCQIINHHGKRLPWGAAGELILIGEQVGHGYLNRPEKTAEVFFEHDGKRAYRSGDIVRYRENGDIEYIGRRDGQVKIRGFRIELKEVEAVIRKYHGISDCTVQAFDLESGGKYIAAYIVSNEKVDIDALNAFIASEKPPYMVPTVTLQIDAIPLNVNQKVDKKKLPKPQLQAANTQQPAPREANMLEKQLMELVKTLTQQEPAINEPLAYYGMNSILSMRLSVMLFKQFNIKISGKDLLGETSILTVENTILASLLGKKQDGKADEAQPQVSEKVVSAPLTFAQQGVYADCLMNPDSTIYNIPLDICLPLSVGSEKLQNVVAQVLEMHPMLFANIYENENGDSLQSIPSSYQAKVEYQKVDEKHNLDDIKHSFVHPYDLKKDRLYRALVVETDSELHLLLDVHHLVCDGGSEDVMIREMIALLNGQKPDGETVPYLQFAINQKYADEKGKMEPYRLFFADLLKDMEENISIPEDKQSTETGRLKKVAKPLPTVQIPHEQGITDATFWFAASAYTVARYTNVHDVYMTTISNGRQDPEIADTVGMFVNTLPVTAHLKDQSAKDYLIQTAADFHGSTEHENYPFARIAADYGYSTDITFAYQLGIIANNTVDGQPVTVQSFGLDTPKFKLGIYVEMNNGVPSLVIKYNDAFYFEESISQLANCILAAATHILAHLEQPIRQISIISDEQMKELDGMRETAHAELPVSLFHQGMERWAEKTPDTLALVACDRSLTYAEFNREANRISHALINKGVQPRDRVCLLLPRRSYYMLSMFAVLKAGAAYIPCDPEYPTERIRLITDDSQARFVITTKDKLANYGERALDIDDLLAFDGETTNPNIDITPDDLAYLIYTSGSTGRPKGVMLRHEGVCNYLTPHPENRHIYAMTSTCKAMLGITTVSFDLSLKELGATLFNGLTLVFANEEEVIDPQKLSELMMNNHVDGFNGTPSRIKTFIELPAFQKALSLCKCIILGGEKYPPTLLPELRKITSARLFNTYGPTETSISCNVSELTNSDTITTGRPLLNVHESVVDMDGNELPVGVMGELYISGKGVARGYNNLPEKTAEAFVTWNERRCYKSGDYARWADNGHIIILGRKDNQIKLNGLRIEIGEVEAILMKQPGVKEGVVMIKSVEGHDHLVAYYVGETDADNLKNGMSKSLTYYMVPSIYIKMDKMPISPNGKTDLKALPEPKLAEREFVQSKNKAELFFCDTFAKILECKRVGATDNFFEIGGTSLVAIRVVIMAKQNGYNIVYKNVFDYPTPRALAEFLGGNMEPTSDSGDSASAILNAEDPEAANYDYTAINEYLSQNTLKSLNEGTLRNTDIAIVTGTTGYLGIHVMHELLENESIKAIFCLVRGNKVQTPESRMRTTLFYYFDNTYESQIGNRLIVLNGDVTNPADFEALEKAINAAHYENANLTLFHCAANVKHFSSGTDIEDINIGGTNNCIDFCLKTGARLIHTSTHSIAGHTVSDTPVAPHILTETQLYWGQRLNSQYTHSKFIAERNVMEAIVTKGLDAKIMRLGNLAPRSTDGEFQMNFHTNSFMGKIKALQTIGSVSYDQAISTIEFSPINEVARAVVLLSATPSKCCIYNPVNSNRQLYNNVLICLENMGISITKQEPEEFAKSLNAAAQDPEKTAILQSLMAYDSGLANKFVVTNTDNPNYTTLTLLRLGFSWNFTTWDYIERFIEAIKGLGFFDDDYIR